MKSRMSNAWYGLRNRSFVSIIMLLPILSKTHDIHGTHDIEEFIWVLSFYSISISSYASPLFASSGSYLVSSCPCALVPLTLTFILLYTSILSRCHIPCIMPHSMHTIMFLSLSRCWSYDTTARQGSVSVLEDPVVNGFLHDIHDMTSAAPTKNRQYLRLFSRNRTDRRP